MLVLYHSGLTTCSRQVRHCLREKGLPYQSRYINLLRFEHLSPAYLKLNPNGVVPTLVHDGHVVINSACINEYLDEAFPQPRLSPTDPKDRARMRYWTWTADDTHLQGARMTRNQRLKSSVESMSADDTRIGAQDHAGAGAARALAEAGGRRSFRAGDGDGARACALHRRPDGDGACGARAVACRRDVFARRHQHGLDRAPRERALSGAVAARELSAHQRLVRAVDGAPGGNCDLYARHRGDAEACTGALGRAGSTNIHIADR